MTTRIVGLDGLRVAGAAGVLPAIVCTDDGRVRVERATPIELTPGEFEALAAERRVTALREPFVSRERAPVVLYADWGGVFTEPLLFQVFFGRAMTSATERIEHLLPGPARPEGDALRVLVCDRDAAHRWATLLLAGALDRLERWDAGERGAPRPREWWSLLQWLEFLVPYTGEHSRANAAHLFAWLLAVASTGRVPAVRPESVVFDLELELGKPAVRAIEARARGLVARHFPSRASPPLDARTPLAR